MNFYGARVCSRALVFSAADQVVWWGIRNCLGKESPTAHRADRLCNERAPVEIDEDVREEYWTNIRNLPECKDRPRVESGIGRGRVQITQTPVTA